VASDYGSYPLSTMPSLSTDHYGSLWHQEWWTQEVLKFARPHLTFFNDLELMYRFEQKQAGETIVIRYGKELSTKGTTALSRGTVIPQNTIEIGSFTVGLDEYGNQVIWYGYFDDVYQDADVQKLVVERLGHDYARTMNDLIKAKYDLWGCGVAGAGGTRLVLHGAGTVYCGTATGGTASVSGASLGTYHLLAARDFLAKNNVPRFSDGFYHYVGHPQVFTGLKEAGLLADAGKYSPGPFQSDILQRAEIGRAFGFRFFEDNTCNVTGGGTNATSYAFGGPAVAMAVGNPMEIRFEPDIGQDYGRAHGAAWYGVYGFENIWKSEPYGLFVVSNSDTRV